MWPWQRQHLKDNVKQSSDVNLRVNLKVRWLVWKFETTKQFEKFEDRPLKVGTINFCQKRISSRTSRKWKQRRIKIEKKILAKRKKKKRRKKDTNGKRLLFLQRPHSRFRVRSTEFERHHIKTLRLFAAWWLGGRRIKFNNGSTVVTRFAGRTWPGVAESSNSANSLNRPRTRSNLHKVAFRVAFRCHKWFCCSQL